MRQRFLWFAVALLSVLLLGPASCKKKASETQAKAGADTTAAAEKGKPAVKAEAEEKARVPEKAKPRERQPSSLDLVEKAAQEGLLDLDAAWISRFQAMFEPEALPEQYRGRGRIPCGTSVLKDFKQARAKLAPETLIKLQPYLVRPTDPESIFAKRAAKLKEDQEEKHPASAKVLTGSGLLFAGEPQQPGRPDKDTIGLFCAEPRAHFKVWAPLNCEFAKIIAEKIESYRMWERFADLMRRTPLPDDKASSNGGDGSLDIYLVPKSPWVADFEDRKSYVCGYCVGVGDGKQIPAYIIVDATQVNDQVIATIAHELFHAFQFAIDSDEEDWWMEGTATWAEEFINSGWNFEHDYDEDAFDKAGHRLLQMTSTQGYHEYAIYLFPFYLASVYTDRIVGEIWRECENVYAYPAVKNVLQARGGDFGEDFKTFAYMNWDQNQDSNVVQYLEEVKAEDYHDRENAVRLPLSNPYAKSLLLEANSAIYYLFKNTEKEAVFPHVVFDLRDFVKPELSVQAYIEYRNKDAKKEDWTGRAEVEFCLNDPDQDFVNVYITLGNAAWAMNEWAELRVRQDGRGCNVGETTAFLTYTEKTTSHSDSSDPANANTAYSDEAFKTEVRIQIVLDYDKSVQHRRDTRIEEKWKVREWRVISFSGNGTKTTFFEDRDVGEEKHFQGIAQRRKTTVELAAKSVSSQKNLPGEMGMVYIIFDEKTGKAVEVQLGSYPVLVEWQGTDKLENLFGDANFFGGKFHGFRTVNREHESTLTTFLVMENMMMADKAGSLIGIFLPGSKSAKVTGGDGINTMSGGGDVAGETPGKSQRRWELSCRWNLTRVVKPAANK